MTNYQHARTAKITCLSPVHIGTGQDFEPTNFKLFGGGLHVFDVADLAKVLTPNERRILLQAADDTHNPIGKLQGFFRKLPNTVLSLTKTSVLLSDVAEQHISQNLGNVVQQGARVFNKFNIPQTAIRPDNYAPYIPGSSLKGAIRTAVLNDLLRKQTRKLDFEETKDRKKLSDYQRKLEKILLKKKDKQMSSDPFRLIKIGDAMPTGPLFTKINFQVNVKKHPKSNQKKVSIPGLLQLIPAMSYQAFACEITKWKAPEQQWLSDDKNRDKLPTLDLTVDEIIDACNEFYLKQFQREKDILTKQGYVDQKWVECVTQLLNDYEPLFRMRKAMLLRVGKHSGAESVTLDEIRMIQVKQGDKKTTIKNASTTLWLASESKSETTGLLPFGWVLLEFEPTECSEKLRGHCQAFQQLDVERYNTMVQRRDEAIEQAKAQEEARRQQEEARRQQEEAERRRAEAEQAKLAELSPTQRKIYMIESEYKRASQQGPLSPTSELINRLALLIKEATDEWALEDRRQLGQLARTIYTATGQIKNKKIKERLKQLENEG